MAVSSFSFQNLFSIRKTKLEVATPVTLLIGPNGSGKSNLLRGIELLSRLADGTFRDTVMRSGGFSDHLFKGTELSDSADLLSVPHSHRAERDAGLSKGAIA